MLAHRIIPTILMKKGHLVKGEGFAADRIVGNALQAAKIHAMRGVDEILMLDVTATKEGREPDYKMIEKLTKTAHVPVTVGGGVNKIEHILKLLLAGADKVCIGTAIDLIEPAAKKFGNQCIVQSLDYPAMQPGQTVHKTEAFGAGEILLQSILVTGPWKGTI